MLVFFVKDVVNNYRGCFLLLYVYYKIFFKVCNQPIIIIMIIVFLFGKEACKSLAKTKTILFNYHVPGKRLYIKNQILL